MKTLEKVKNENIKSENNNRNGYVSKTTIKKWGNSQGIRLSKQIMEQMNLKENDMIQINVYNGKMSIEKVNNPKYLNLKERLEAFYNKPIEEIYVDNVQEADVGAPVGEELW